MINDHDNNKEQRTNNNKNKQINFYVGLCGKQTRKMETFDNVVVECLHILQFIHLRHCRLFFRVCCFFHFFFCFFFVCLCKDSIYVMFYFICCSKTLYFVIFFFKFFQSFFGFFLCFLFFCFPQFVCVVSFILFYLPFFFLCHVITVFSTCVLFAISVSILFLFVFRA